MQDSDLFPPLPQMIRDLASEAKLENTFPSKTSPPAGHRAFASDIRHGRFDFLRILGCSVTPAVQEYMRNTGAFGKHGKDKKADLSQRILAPGEPDVRLQSQSFYWLRTALVDLLYRL